MEHSILDQWFNENVTGKPAYGTQPAERSEHGVARDTSCLHNKLAAAIRGRGRELAEQLGLRRRGKSFYCPLPENHKHGERSPSGYVHPDSGYFKCYSASCGVKGSLVWLAGMLGHADPWGEVVRLTGVNLDENEKRHLDNLKKKDVR